jgi:hypothetical protein
MNALHERRDGLLAHRSRDYLEAPVVSLPRRA